MGALIEALRSGLTRDRAQPQDAVASAAARKFDTLIWAIIAATAAVAVLGALGNGFSVVWKSLNPPIVVGAALIWFARFYYRRGDVRLATALESTAQIMAFAAIGAPLSYLAATLNFPLHDGVFDALDKALGFDWMALLAFMNAHPSLHPLFQGAYDSFSIQATTTVLALAITNRSQQLRVFVLAFVLAALVTITVSAILPAEGAWGYYGLSAADTPAIVPVTRGIHLPIFFGLRDGSYRLMMAAGAEGIITFPSLHAALAIIFILALWPVLYVRWIALTVNVLMLMSTLIDGGHYFFDVLAGIVVASACWLAAQRIAAAFKLSRPA